MPRLLVAVQVCLAVVLLSAAGLLVRSLVELHRVDVGFDPSDVVTLRLTLPSSSHPSPVERARLFGEVVERIAAVPGVESAGGVNDLPFSGSRTQRSFEVAGGTEWVPGTPETGGLPGGGRRLLRRPRSRAGARRGSPRRTGRVLRGWRW